MSQSQVIDIVKPEPKTELELWQRRMNATFARMFSRLPSRKVIDVVQLDRTAGWPDYDPDPNHCSGYGQKYCLEQGRHSFFNHSQDSFKRGSLSSNAPGGFIQP